MKQLMNRIEDLVKQYENELFEKGIACSVSKKYFETKTPTSSFHYYNLLDILLCYFADKRENKKFKHQPNRIHCAVLCFYPINDELIKKSNCKEYAFVLYEVSRLEEGFAPKTRIYKENNILKKVEKRIKKVLKSAEKKGALKHCKHTKLDLLRYFFKSEYGYKKTVLGISRNTLDTVFSVSFLAVILIVISIIYFCLK